MAPWYFFEAASDPNKAWDTTKHIFVYIADSHAPLTKGKFWPMDYTPTETKYVWKGKA